MLGYIPARKQISTVKIFEKKEKKRRNHQKKEKETVITRKVALWLPGPYRETVIKLFIMISAQPPPPKTQIWDIAVRSLPYPISEQGSRLQ